MHDNQLSLNVLVRGREKDIEVREYVSPLDQKTYIEGREGSEFFIRIRNGTASRIVAVPSVDGLSVFDGKPASAQSRGFVIDALGTCDVKGWKLDNESVASFYFAGMNNASDDSYVARKGGAVEHKGVIGVIFFSEEAPPPAAKQPTILYHNRRSAGELPPLFHRQAPSPGEVSSNGWNDEGQLGTGFGKKKSAPTKSVEFKRGGELGRLALFYDDARGLKRRGIDVTARQLREPNPFPADNGCTPPPGWGG